MEKKTVMIGNRRIEIRLSEEWDEITFWENNMQLEGTFNFTEDDENHGRYLLRRMYSPLKFSGLGKAALKFFIEITNGIIWTREPHEEERNDQSHLTGDAQSFIIARQMDGLIEPWRDFFPEN